MWLFAQQVPCGVLGPMEKTQRPEVLAKISALGKSFEEVRAALSSSSCTILRSKYARRYRRTCVHSSVRACACIASLSIWFCGKLAVVVAAAFHCTLHVVTMLQILPPDQARKARSALASSTAIVL